MIAHSKVKLVFAVLFALVLGANFTAFCFADDSLETYSFVARVSVTYDGGISWTPLYNIPAENVSYSYDSDSGYNTIVFTNMSNVFSSPYIWQIGLYVYKYIGNNRVTRFNASNYSVDSFFSASASNEGIFQLDSSHLSNGETPLHFMSQAVSGGGSYVGRVTSDGLRNNALVQHFFDFGSDTELRYFNLNYSGFYAFGDVDITLRFRFVIDDVIVRLDDSISSFDDTLSSFDPLWEDLQTFNNALPTFVPADLATADSIAISVFPHNTGTLFSFMNTELVTYIFILVVFFTVLSIIIFGHSGG